MNYAHKVAGLIRFADFLVQHGIQPGSVLKRLGLPPSMLLDGEAWIPRGISYQLVEEVARVTGQPLAGVTVARLTEFDDYGEWGWKIQSAPTLRAAVRVAAGEIRRIVTGTHLKLVEEGRQARLVISYSGREDQNSPQYLEANLMWLRNLLDLTIEPVSAKAILPHRPATMTGLEADLGPHLAVQDGVVAMVMHRDALDLPLRAYQVPYQNGSRVQSTDRSPLDTTRAVFQALEDTIEFERPTVRGVSHQLSINPRTMQRHLASWDVTFEELLDAYRQRMSVQLLQQESLTVTDVALRLGYSDAPHFIRAFRRWTGGTPRRYMKEREHSEPCLLGYIR